MRVYHTPALDQPPLDSFSDLFGGELKIVARGGEIAPSLWRLLVLG
jgi:hypothetical protein